MIGLFIIEAMIFQFLPGTSGRNFHTLPLFTGADDQSACLFSENQVLLDNTIDLNGSCFDLAGCLCDARCERDDGEQFIDADSVFSRRGGG